MVALVLHDRLGHAAVFYAAVMGAWGLWKWRRGGSIDANYLGALVVGEGLLMAIAAIGIWLAGTGLAPGRWIHILYGILSLLMWPFAFAVTRGSPDRRAAAVYGWVSLFIAGLAMRAIGTA
jgi:hypothetical protein